MIPQGYKQTEIGVIPKEWSVLKLQDCASFLDHKRIPIKDSDRKKMRGSYPYYGASGIIDYVDSYIFDGTYILLGEDGANIIDRSSRLAFIVNGKCWINNHAHVIVPTPSIDIYFLSEYLESIKYDEYNTGTAQPKLNREKCNGIPIAVPSLNEQKRIAKVLSDVDSMISSLEKLIAKKKAVRQGAMQELLTGKKRLPGFAGDWENVSLGEIGTITGSGVDKKILPDEQPITLLNYTNVYHQITIARQDLNHQVTASYEKIKNCSVMKGDVFLTPTSETPEDIALSAVALEDMEDVVYSYHVVRLRPKLNHNGAFINYALSTPMFREQAVQFAEGSGIRYVITLKKFKEMQVYLPIGKAEQDGIVSILSDMDNEIEALDQKLAKTRQLKQGMMQQLLTGKIRLV